MTEMCSLATDSQLYFITQLVHLGDLFVCLLEIPLQSDFSLYLSKMSTSCWSRARTAPKFLSCFPSLLFYPLFAHTVFFNLTLAEVLTGKAGNRDNLFFWDFLTFLSWGLEEHNYGSSKHKEHSSPFKKKKNWSIFAPHKPSEL